MVTTTDNVPGTRVVKTVGQGFALTVRSRSTGGNIAAGLQSLAGGEVGTSVKLQEEDRQALDRRIQDATMGANVGTMMRFDSTESWGLRSPDRLRAPAPPTSRARRESLAPGRTAACRGGDRGPST